MRGPVRRSLRMRIKGFLGLGLLTLGVWLLLPSRNVLGNPAFETLQGSCRIAHGTLVRLYRGDGGATTGYWYSVTTQPGFPWTERQIYGAYSSPVVESVSCHGDSVSLHGQLQ